MNLDDLKLESIGLDKTKFGRIYTFVDFGNVNKWFGKDVWGWADYKLKEGEHLIIDIEKLANFTDSFSLKKFFYYGFNPQKKSSMHLMVAARKIGFKTITKPIQWIRHYLSREEEEIYQNPLLSEQITKGTNGTFITIPKCNFDVELCLDVVRLKDHYDTICIFTSDNDFALLLDYLRKQGKKVILIYANPIRQELKDKANLSINSQDVKSAICCVKEITETFAEHKKRTSP